MTEQIALLPKRLPAKSRKAQIVKTASALFAQTGLHGTTTQALAKAARITQPILYAHFSSKDELFRVAVENNIAARLDALGERLAANGAAGTAFAVIEDLAKETMGACVAPDTNATLTNWALLEAPEYAADLYRNEFGAVEIIWERELRRRLRAQPSTARSFAGLIPLAINACLAYGFWLAALRHTPATARELACQYASVLAQVTVDGAALCRSAREDAEREDRIASSGTPRQHQSAEIVI
jgi:AcrR family transcriptional regulator